MCECESVCGIFALSGVQNACFTCICGEPQSQALHSLVAGEGPVHSVGWVQKHDDEPNLEIICLEAPQPCPGCLDPH